MGDLESMILAKRENNFKGFLNYMESKYGGMDDDEEKDNLKGKNKKRVKKAATGGKEET